MKTDRPSPPGAAQGTSGGAGAPSFENAIKRLGEIVEQLESGELPLDASLKLFEEGVGLSRQAGDLLELAERRVEALTRAADGSLGTVPFDAGDEEDRSGSEGPAPRTARARSDASPSPGER